MQQPWRHYQMTKLSLQMYEVKMNVEGLSGTRWGTCRAGGDDDVDWKCRVSRKNWWGGHAHNIRMKMLGNIFSTMAKLLVQVIRGDECLSDCIFAIGVRFKEARLPQITVVRGQKQKVRSKEKNLVEGLVRFTRTGANFWFIDINKCTSAAPATGSGSSLVTKVVVAKF